MQMPTLEERCPMTIQVTPGVHERVVIVETRNGPPPPAPTEEPPPGAKWFVAPDHWPAERMRQYLAAIDAGLFDGPTEGARGQVLHTEERQEGTATYHAWELHLPPLAPDALVPLLRMLAFTTSIGEIRLTEKAPAEAATLRTLEALGRAPRFGAPWAAGENLAIHKAYQVNAKDSVVVVTFEDDAPPDLVTTTHAVLRAWAEMVCAGAFEGAENTPCSGGVLGELGTEADNEVMAAFDFLTCMRDGWDALQRGLLHIHRTARISRLEVGT